MMDVFRMQDEDGRGPYAGRPDLNQGWQEVCHMMQVDRTPGPCDDPGMNHYHMLPSRRDEWKFGFESLERLYSWFSLGEIKELRRLGFGIVRLECDEVKSSKFQSIYHGLATLIEKDINHDERLGEYRN